MRQGTKRRSVFWMLFFSLSIFHAPLPVYAENANRYLYGSTVSTVFDIIKINDPSSFSCLRSDGHDLHQVWDKRLDDEPLIYAYTFTAYFSDGHSIKMVVNPEFGSKAAARSEANRYV